MAEEVLDDKTTVETGDTTAPSTETKPDADEEPETDGKPAADKKADTDQDTGKPDDPDEKTPKPDKDGRIQVRLEQFDRLKRQKSEFKEELEALREFGIDSKEHAAKLRQDADSYHYIVEQLEADPEKFFTGMQQSFPKALETHDATVIQSFLSLASDAYRRQGDTEGQNTADVLAEVLKTVRGQARSRPEGSDQSREKESLAGEKWELFSDHVQSERDRALSAKVEELLPKGTDFRSPKVRQKFISGVIEDVMESLRNDTVFRRELAYAENPRRGLGRSQREEAVKAYVKYANLHDSRLIRNAIAEQASLLNIAVTANGKDGKPAAVRREASSTGGPSSGSLTAEDKTRLREEIMQNPKIPPNEKMTAYLSEIRKRTVRA